MLYCTQQAKQQVYGWHHAHDKHTDLHTKFHRVGVSELVISRHNEGLPAAVREEPAKRTGGTSWEPG